MDRDKLLGEATEKYAWVRDIEAWTVAVIANRTAAEVVRIYGGDPAEPVGEYFFGEAADLQGGGYPDELRFHLQVFEHEGQVVALENNGWSGSIPEIARRCSAPEGHFFSVYWNVNAFGMVTEARDGNVTASFESLYPLAPEAQQGEVRPDWALGPEVDPELAWQVGMALMEEQTGLRFDQRWLATKLPTYRIPEADVLFAGVEGVREV